MAALSSDALLALPCSTPAFVYDEAKITEQGRRLRQFADDANLRLLFAVKSLSVAGGIIRK